MLELPIEIALEPPLYILLGQLSSLGSTLMDISGEIRSDSTGSMPTLVGY